MVDETESQKPRMDRRKFLLIAGIGAAIGALTLAAGSRKLFQGLLSSSQAQGGTRTPGSATGAPRLQPTGGSFLSRLLGRPR